jgi:hypothetical protein
MGIKFYGSDKVLQKLRYISYTGCLVLGSETELLTEESKFNALERKQQCR